MAAKPWHIGHQKLVELACSECDDVHLYVSSSDRIRTGEFPIHAKVMQKIWNKAIKSTLPSNVTSVEFVSNPVSAVYKRLGEANDKPLDDIVIIYSDPIDMNRNFPEKNFKKYAENLLMYGLVEARSVSRSETVNVSGTQMRLWLMNGDKENFIAHLPTSFDGDLIWKIFTGK